MKNVISTKKALNVLAKQIMATILPRYGGNRDLAWKDAYALAVNRLMPKSSHTKTSKAKMSKKRTLYKKTCKKACRKPAKKAGKKRISKKNLTGKQRSSSVWF